MTSTAIAAATAAIAVTLIVMAVHLTDSRMDQIEDRLRTLEDWRAAHSVLHPRRTVENPTSAPARER